MDYYDDPPPFCRGCHGWRKLYDRDKVRWYWERWSLVWGNIGRQYALDMANARAERVDPPKPAATIRDSRKVQPWERSDELQSMRGRTPKVRRDMSGVRHAIEHECNNDWLEESLKETKDILDNLTPEQKEALRKDSAFWQGVEKTAAEVGKWPEWKRRMSNSRKALDDLSTTSGPSLRKAEAVLGLFSERDYWVVTDHGFEWAPPDDAPCEDPWQLASDALAAIRGEESDTRWPCRCGRIPSAAVDGPWSCGTVRCALLAGKAPEIGTNQPPALGRVFYPRKAFASLEGHLFDHRALLRQMEGIRAEAKFGVPAELSARDLLEMAHRAGWIREDGTLNGHRMFRLVMTGSEPAA